jgi:hypothetical protein
LTDHWKQIAWNGVSFKAPSRWEFSRVGTRHLILEDEAGPVLEVKWAPVKGSFSHRAHLKRLYASQPRNIKAGIAEWFLPPPWQKALADYEARGFLWQTENSGARGAILFCPVCRVATLIQFLGESTADHEREILAILGSFRDHRGDGMTSWQVFDLLLKLPAALKLSHFRFNPGKYELSFSDGRQSVRLFRWAPAAAILGGGDLMWFCGTVPDFSVGRPKLLTVDGYAAVEGSAAPAGAWRNAISRLKIKPSFFWFRLWHLQDKNRLLGLRAESKRSLDVELLQQICKDYESL